MKQYRHNHPRLRPILIWLGYFFLSLGTVLGLGISWQTSATAIDTPITSIIQGSDTLPKANTPWQTYSDHSLSLSPLLPLSPSPSLASNPTPGSTNPVIALTTDNLIQQGRDAYTNGHYQQAIQLWQQAADQLAAAGNPLKQASILSHIALAQQQLGDWPTAETTISNSLTLLEQPTLKKQTNYHNILGQVLTAQGHLQLNQSQAATALTAFEQAETAYATANNTTGTLRSQINQAQALQTLGFYRRAITILTDVTPPLTERAPSLTQATGLRKLGDLYRITGNIEQSHAMLHQSLAIAHQLNGSTAHILFSLGNTDRVEGNTEQAVAYYNQVIETKPSSQLLLQARLAQLDLQLNQSLSSSEETTIRRAIANIHHQLSELPASRSSVYGHLTLARSLLAHPGYLSHQAIAQLLNHAVDQARVLKDYRSESYGLGHLGELYLQQKSLSEASLFLTQALQTAQTVNAFDIAYRWQWLLGKLRAEQGNKERAIATYTQSIQSLEKLRSDLVATNPDIQYDFRESVEPVYRELVDLLLTPTTDGSPIEQNNLIQARDVIESLQLAELENFFREPCLAPQKQVDQVIDTATLPTAVIYPVILPNRLAVILKLPNQPLKNYSIPIPETALDSTVEQLQDQILKPYTGNQVKTLANQLYTWLLQPLETDLNNAHIDTLVFVLDGSLRNIPMAVLYDGQQYLIEKYSLALAPGLTLVDPKPVAEQTLAAIAAGLSEARHGFPPLKHVRTEVNHIQSELPSHVLIDQTFTQTALETAINQTPFPVVHLATHGKFSSDPDETYILAWDQQIKINTLNRLLRNSEQSRTSAIELLILSACQTATGDKRAALGLAGVAVRAGARSTVASLWSLDDETSAVLMAQFYRVLTENLTEKQTTKAASLRQAQLALLHQPRYQHPRYWAPYVLLGNWL